jgi:4-amino-4-deoxy-L-arabinose transferase-like glycosyltransferase
MEGRRARSAELLGLLAILALAAVLRFGWPSTTEFKGDEARIALLALDMAEGRSFPLKGTGTSVGLPKSPLSVYVYAVPFLVSANPLVATLFTGALNVLAVYLCWRLARRYWGVGPGLLAALFYAASPWAVLFSRKIWEPNLLSPFVAAWMLSGLKTFVEGRRWALLWHIVLLAVLVQLHYSALVLVPVTGLLLILCRRRLRWRSLLAGVGVSALTAVPFACYLLRGGSGVRQAVLGLMSQAPKVDAESARFWWSIVSGSGIHSLAGPQVFRDYLASVPYSGPACWAAGLLAIVGIIAAAEGALVRRNEPGVQAAGIVSLWALAPLVVFARHSMPLYLHYYVVALPAPFLAAAFALGRLRRLRSGLLRLGAAIPTLAAAGAQAAMVVELFAFLGSRATPDGFGTPLGVQLRAVRAAREAELPVVVVGPGDDPQTSDWPAVFSVLLRRTRHRLVDGTYVACFPGSPSTLLIVPGADAAMRVYRAAGVLAGAQELPSRVGEAPFRVVRAEGLPDLGLSRRPTAALLANGVEVLGCRWDGNLAPGETVTWWLAWRVANPPPVPLTEYHVFNHLEDSAGKRWAQVDGPTVRVCDWAVGDTNVELFRLELPGDAPPAPYRMRVGMYTYPALQRQPVVDGAGQPVSDAVTLDPLGEP